MKDKEFSSICERLGVAPYKPVPESKIGIALDTVGLQPINGLRHPVEGETNGWYIWCGDGYSDHADFFSPLHVEHISNYLPKVQRYLDLPPGYRFQIDDNGFEDVWFDPSLLVT